MCAPSRYVIFRLTPVIADHFLCPALIAACSYQPSIHVSRLQPSSFTLNLQNSTKITVCFHYIQPSKPAPRLQSTSIEVIPPSLCQDYSLLPLYHSIKTQIFQFNLYVPFWFFLSLQLANLDLSAPWSPGRVWLVPGIPPLDWLHRPRRIWLVL